MKFSQKIGKTKVRSAIQVEAIDEILTNKLWNILTQYYDSLSPYSNANLGAARTYFSQLVWTDFFHQRVDRVSNYGGTKIHLFEEGKFYFKPVYDYVEVWFFNCEWYEKFDFIEFILEQAIQCSGLGEKINIALENEMSAYRVVDDSIVQITSEVEIAEIENALGNENDPINLHLTTALEYLANRDKPDYRNSIKESISAVESICQKITGDDKATVGKALAKIEKQYSLHVSLKSSFSTLYGYTSDASGIRHALADQAKEISFEEAKFMLVVCCAFVNYLKNLTIKN